MWTTLNFKVRSQTKVMARDICKMTLHIQFERDWWVGLGPELGDGKKFRYIFPVSGIFSGKFASMTFSGFECTINPQNVIKIVGAIFEKINFLIFSYVDYP